MLTIDHKFIFQFNSNLNQMNFDDLNQRLNTLQSRYYLLEENLRNQNLQIQTLTESVRDLEEFKVSFPGKTVAKSVFSYKPLISKAEFHKFLNEKLSNSLQSTIEVRLYPELMKLR